MADFELYLWYFAFMRVYSGFYGFSNGLGNSWKLGFFFSNGDFNSGRNQKKIKDTFEQIKQEKESNSVNFAHKYCRDIRMHPSLTHDSQLFQ